MDRSAKKIGVLVKNGTLYDLATTYSYLLHDRLYTKDDLNLVANILNKGYTYEDVIDAILFAFYNHQQFPLQRFQRNSNKNLLKHGKDVRYFYKELNVMAEMPPVDVDYSTCTITRTPYVFWLEPRASYTMEDMLTYFDAYVLYDKSQYPPNRLRKIFEQYINKIGIDLTMLMIEHAIRMSKAEGVEFTYRKFDEYQPIARQYLGTVRTNLSYDKDGLKYELRKRVLPH